MDFNHQLLFDYLADDKSVICYRPQLNQITGSVLSTILLQQIMYWYKQNNFKPFYKFKSPCQHRYYKPGDSWLEETGFSLYEFNSAIQKIGIKITKENRGKAHNFLIEYWKTVDNITYFQVNIDNLMTKIQGLSRGETNHFPEVDTTEFPKQEISISREVDNINFHIAETTRDYIKNSSSSFHVETTSNKQVPEIKQKLIELPLPENEIETILENYSNDLDRVLTQTKQTEWLYNQNIINNRALIFKKNCESGYIDHRYKQHLQELNTLTSQTGTMPDKPQDNKLQPILDKYRYLTGHNISSNEDLIRLYKAVKYSNSDLLSILEAYYTNYQQTYFKSPDLQLDLSDFLADHILLNKVYEHLKASNIEMWSSIKNLFHKQHSKQGLRIS